MIAWELLVKWQLSLSGKSSSVLRSNYCKRVVIIWEQFSPGQCDSHPTHKLEIPWQTPHRLIYRPIFAFLFQWDMQTIFVSHFSVLLHFYTVKPLILVVKMWIDVSEASPIDCSCSYSSFSIKTFAAPWPFKVTRATFCHWIAVHAGW